MRHLDADDSKASWMTPTSITSPGKSVLQVEAVDYIPVTTRRRLSAAVCAPPPLSRPKDRMKYTLQAFAYDHGVSHILQYI